MVRGHQKFQWRHTSEVLAMLANANRNTKLRPYPFTFEDFNPFSESRGPRGVPFNKETSRLLAQALTGKKAPDQTPSRWDLLRKANPCETDPST